MHEFRAQEENERQGSQTRQERKQRILTRGAPSITESIAEALSETLMFENGDVWPGIDR